MGQESDVAAWGNGSGVFPKVVNHCAFFDRVRIGIWGRKRPSPGDAVSNSENEAIGGEGSYYGRVERGVLTATGNPYELKYAVMRLRGIIPPVMLTLRSDRTPLTMANVLAAINALCEKGWEAKISEVELTFDLTGTSVEFLRKSTFTPARKFPHCEDEYGRRTQYFGTRNSPWQLKVYDKNAGVVRLEFTFRRDFFRKHGWDAPADLQRLRNLDLEPLVRLCELNRGGLKRLENRIFEDYIRRIPASWAQGLPLREFLRAVKRDFAAQPETLLVRSPLERKLRNMQRRLIWSELPIGKVRGRRNQRTGGDAGKSKPNIAASSSGQVADP